MRISLFGGSPIVKLWKISLGVKRAIFQVGKAVFAKEKAVKAVQVARGSLFKNHLLCKTPIPEQ